MSMNLEVLDALASDNLTSYCSTRYRGDGFSFALEQFHPLDLERFLSVYSGVERVYTTFLYLRERGEVTLETMSPALKVFQNGEIARQARDLGIDTKDHSAEFSRALHDVRGGALTSLLGYFELGLETEIDLLSFIGLARDQAKMMRHSVPELDPIIAEVDTQLAVHTVDGYLEKWRDFKVFAAGSLKRVQVNNSCQGFISERCLETSAIERIVYNLINNAARFSSTDLVVLNVIRAGTEVSRWVVTNPIDSVQAAWLSRVEAEAGHLSRFFLGGLSRGGNGVGLSSCASLVAAAFGRQSIEEAVTDGLVGCRVIDDTFYSWFHWPMLFPAQDSPVCHCKSHSL